MVKTFRDIKKILKENKKSLFAKYKVKELGVFGSYARGEQNRKSDVDILVDFTEIPDVFAMIDMEEYLARLLNKKVDLVRKKVIRLELRKTVLNEAKYI